MGAYRLVVAEKPSVARDLARVLGVSGRQEGWIGTDEVRVTWCLGHLVELANPATYDEAWRRWDLDLLPMVPDGFRLQARKDGDRDQWRVVRGLLGHRDCREVVNACDAGREGELIFAWCYELAGARAPVARLWVSSMTDGAIRDGFQRLRPGRDLAALEAAARSRAEADWLVGLNATRAMTLRVSRDRESGLLSLGRVQTPTLALLDAREGEIEGFVPRAFWQVKARFAGAGGEWEATWVRPDGEGKVGDRTFLREEAEAVLARVTGRDGAVAAVERKEARERPPLLYDLTALQREANQRFGFTAQQTLSLAQALYERHKVLTYPRTDARHLATAQVPDLHGVVRGVAFGPYAAGAEVALARDPRTLGPRVVDDAEVSDHHAIIPTGQDPRPRGLSPEEKRIFDLVVRRFLGAFHPDARFAAVVVDTDVAAERFRARGRTRLEAGWQAVDPPRSQRRDVDLPALAVGDEARGLEYRLHEGETQPPKRYDEAALLGAMERAGEALEEEDLKRAMKRNGLGTPATRAAIIETLLQRGFVERKERTLVPTPRGRALVRAVPVEVLCSPRLTGQWEARLAAMAEGEESREGFMADVRRFTEEVVAAIRGAAVPPALEQAFVEVAEGVAALGECPRCGAEVRRTRGGWRCSGCPVSIPERVARREVSPRMAQRLLRDGQTAVVKGFRSREGREFAAALALDPEGRVTFAFPEPEDLGACPACGTPVRRRGKVWTCATGRECRFVVFGEMSGREVPEAAVRQLLADGRSRPVAGFKDRGGQAFTGALRWNGERVVVTPVDLREDAGPAGSCPRCGSPVAFGTGAWRCRDCPFRIPGQVARRDLGRDEVAALLGGRRTARLHGFRQAGGAVFKAALFLDGEGRVQLDFTGGDTPREVPAGGPPPAFGAPVDCPLCVYRALAEPGYLVAGRSAWGCSRWREGCGLRVPFVVEGRRLEEEEARRLFGKHRATRYLAGFGDRPRTARVSLVLDGDPCFRVEERGGRG